MQDIAPLVSGSRRVIKGLRDGDLLLDSALRLTSETQCLQRLVAAKLPDCTGMQFEDNICNEEGRDRFRAFIRTSSSNHAAAVSSSPGCLQR